MSAKERAQETAKELLRKLGECIAMSDTIASTDWEDKRTVRKFADVSLALYEVAKEVEEYDFYSKR